jgi:hypothetical protein
VLDLVDVASGAIDALLADMFLNISELNKYLIYLMF